MMTESEEDPAEGIPQHLLNEDYALALYLQVNHGVLSDPCNHSCVR